MSTYPFLIPSGTVLMPAESGVQALGSVSNPFGAVYTQQIVVSGALVDTSTFVQKAGSTMTGNLVMSGNIVFGSGYQIQTNQDFTIVSQVSGQSISIYPSNTLNLGGGDGSITASSTLSPTTSGNKSLGTAALPWGTLYSDSILLSGQAVNLSSFVNKTGDSISGPLVSSSTYSGTSFIGDTTMVNFIMDGAGAVLSSGSQGQIEIPFNASAVSWDLTAVVSGSLSVDVRRTTYVAWSGTGTLTGSNSIVGSEKPTITTAFKGQDTSLTTWSGIVAGDILDFHIDQSPTNITRATLSLKLKKLS